MPYLLHHHITHQEVHATKIAPVLEEKLNLSGCGCTVQVGCSKQLSGEVDDIKMHLSVLLQVCPLSALHGILITCRIRGKTKLALLLLGVRVSA